MLKAFFLTLAIVFFLLFLGVDVIGAVFGTVFGLIGGAIGLVVGLIGAAVGLAAGMFGLVIGICAAFIPLLIIALIIGGIIKLISPV